VPNEYERIETKFNENLLLKDLEKNMFWLAMGY